MPKQNYPGIDARLVSIVRIKCKHLIGRYGIRAEDLEDFHQDWISKAIRTPEYHNREHPQFTTYIGRVIDRLIISEIRRRKAAQRDYRMIAYSLDDYREGSDEGKSKNGTISDEDYLNCTGTSFVEHRDTVALRHDVEAFLETLPQEIREVAIHMMHHPMIQITATIGISRATAYRRMEILRKAAQEFFSENGETLF